MAEGAEAPVAADQFKAVIKIADDFTPAPGGRLTKTGPFSGELFRRDLLVPNLKYAKDHDLKLTVVLDDAVAYPVSFLEEAFGGLIRVEGFSLADVKRYLVVQANDRFYEPFKQLIETYLGNAKAA